MKNLSTQLVVIGAGPGGYAAAFRAADLGLQVTLIDLEEKPGGVCLFRGCIPSKALLHAAKVLQEAKAAKNFGIEFAPPRIDLNALRNWKNGIVQKLTGGLGDLCQQRKINFLKGRASFEDDHTLLVQPNGEGNQERLTFEQAIIATGSRPFIPTEFNLESPHLWNSTSALEISEIPKTLLVIGGGYIGLELGTVYAALGSQVSVVEMTSSLLPGVDRDLVRVLAKKVENIFASIRLNTQVTGIREVQEGLEVSVRSAEKEEKLIFEKVLIAIGRKPNSSGIGLQSTSVEVGEKGFIKVNVERRTSVPHIFAIGDVAGQPMLAHKATHEGLVAAQVAAGRSASFEPQAIPAVVFTDPEIAWCGLTETEAKAQNRKINVSRFPWGASGRALTLDRTDGVTKLITDPETDQILGVAIVGSGAGELISEGVLAIEMGATATDLSLTIHPHPTLTETLMEAAEGVEGLGLHLYRPAPKAR